MADHTAATAALTSNGAEVRGARRVIERSWRPVTAALIALALPLLLIGANLQLLLNSGWLYSYNWWRNGVPERSGIEKPELDRAARTIKAYFDTPQSQELLDVRVSSGGRDVAIYTDREILHMRDVKTLVRGFLAAGLWSGVAVVVLSAAAAAALRRRYWAFAAQAVKWSAAGTVLAIVTIGVASVINFGAVFTLFHRLGFANDLWQLDYGDYLLLMFPERFWFEATLLLGALIVCEFAGLYLAVTWLKNRAERGVPSPLAGEG